MKKPRNKFFQKNKFDQAMTGYLFLLPALVALLVFLIGPIFYAFYISFFRFSFLEPQNAKFIGFSNYIHLFQDKEFLRALWNTSLYTIVVVPIQTAIALFLALIVNNIRGKTFFRVAYYLPTVTSTVAVSVMFTFIFQPDGILNKFLENFGIHGPNYFNSPTFALPAIMMMAIWSSVGQFMIIYLAGLQDIPEEVYEAAELDGARGFRLLWHVTLPLLKRTTFLNVVMSMIGTFQVFDQAYVISGGNGGPLNSTLTVVLDIFRKGFKTMQMGYASAMAFVLFAIILIFTLIQNYFLGREDK
ncbi:sugar ABC transporter permease [Heyndrickxia shackletonii]|uniref:Sugar ABC transporter permease n=2 Tax=Bacillaceae TaxID=186817 RepID=A0A0Q3WW97_9BACI|nr:sugar ABC transporter permease [Heyndrickxia shackletonii]KQL53023.1 sugar ABC transporter permease [Heyndrickxia shackletonii]NEY98575.1 sugar ABC transporter permease [Heyndrickxia shackletonii]